MSGGSFAPMENSPPGMNAMPLGIVAGAAILLGTVGPNIDGDFASAVDPDFISGIAVGVIESAVAEGALEAATVDGAALADLE